MPKDYPLGARPCMSIRKDEAETGEMAIEIPAYNIAYMALPKAGCTTVKQALAQIDPDFDTKAAGLELDPIDLVHRVYQTKRFRPHRWELYDQGWWRFCVVRDPLKRIISCYTNRVVEMKELHNSRNLLRGRINLPMDPDPDFFFQNLQRYRDASSTMRHHLFPAWLFLGQGIERYERIYPIEELDQLIDDLETRTGQTIKRGVHNKTKGVKLTLDDLSAETQHALDVFLEDEYKDHARWYANPFK